MNSSIIHSYHGPVHLLASCIPNVKADVSIIFDRSLNFLKAESDGHRNRTFVEKYALRSSHNDGGLAHT